MRMFGLVGAADVRQMRGRCAADARDALVGGTHRVHKVKGRRANATRRRTRKRRTRKRRTTRQEASERASESLHSHLRSCPSFPPSVRPSVRPSLPPSFPPSLLARALSEVPGQRRLRGQPRVRRQARCGPDYRLLAGDRGTSKICIHI